MSQHAEPSTSSGDSSAASDRPRRRVRRWLAAAGVALIAYAAFGFLLAPRILRNVLQDKGTAALRRQVTVEDVKVNPFTLAVTVVGLEVADLGAPRLAGWESLYVRLAPWKLLQRTAGLAELRLTRPYGRLALDPSGRLNIDDLLGGGEPSPPAQPAARRATLAVALDRLEIVEARLDFEDASRTPAFQTTLGPLTIRLTDFHSRGNVDSPYAFSGSTERGETFSWRGTVLSDPVRSSGTFSFAGFQLPKYDPYLRDLAPSLLVESGVVSAGANYQLEWGEGSRKLLLSDLRVVVEDLALARRRDRARAIQVPRFELSGGEIDALGRVASVAEVKALDARVQARRERDGSVALVEMLARPPARPAPPSAGKDGPAWRWTVGTVALVQAAVEAEDLVPPRAVKLSLAEVNLRLSGLGDRADVACPLTGSLRWGKTGRASVTGTVWPLGARANLAVQAEGIDLAPIGPYLDGVAPVRLAGASLGLAARTTIDSGGAVPVWTFAGDVRLDGLSLRHPSRDGELVRWRSLEVIGVDAASATARVSVKTVRLTEPSLRAVVFEDGTNGLGGGAPAPTPAKAPRATGPAGPPWRVSMSHFQLLRGKATFTDHSVRPPVLLSLTDVEARVASLSSDPGVRPTVEARAAVNGVAPVTVTGTLNPLQAAASTDLAVVARGVDLTPFDGYAGKHLGYGLQKGKLDLDLAYRAEAPAIHARAIFRIDQLTLGEATNSPEATRLPMRLAVSLLKDRDGLILLDVPVEGRTDDPEFRLGAVMWDAVLNVLARVVASPLTLLAALPGGAGEEDLSLVEFAPGSADLDDHAVRRIKLLAQSLAQRPGLSLGLEPTVDAKADPPALWRDGGQVDVAGLLAARQGAARDALVAAGVEPTRLFTVKGGERASTESGSRVYFTVR
jgi:hypothetical protein